MTNITATKDGNKYRLECIDHADSKEVCAGISAICYMLAGSVMNNRYEHLEYDLSPGHAVVAFESDDLRTDEDFRCCLIGLLQIELSHPKELKITQDIM